MSGSNAYASRALPASDAGQQSTRASFVSLLGATLQLTGEDSARLGFAAFATDVVASEQLVSTADTAAQSKLVARLERTLHPRSGADSWTNIEAGVRACWSLLADASNPIVVVVSDGHAEGPAGGPDEQLANIEREIMPGIKTAGGRVFSVLYGADANAQASIGARTMGRLAAMGDGRLFSAASELELLRTSVEIAAESRGVEFAGYTAPVNGRTTIPLTVPDSAATLAIVVIRSDVSTNVAVLDPSGADVARFGIAGLTTLTAAMPIDAPEPGTYDVTASGTKGAVFAAALLRIKPQVVASGVGSPATPTASQDSTLPQTVVRAGSRLRNAPLVGAFAIAFLIGATLMIAHRRRLAPRGVLIVWQGDRRSTVYLADHETAFRRRSGLPLTRLLPEPVNSDCWISVRRGRLWWREGHEKPRLLAPDSPVRVPGLEQVTITYTERPSRAVAEQSRPERLPGGPFSPDLDERTVTS